MTFSITTNTKKGILLSTIAAFLQWKWGSGALKVQKQQKMHLLKVVHKSFEAIK